MSNQHSQTELPTPASLAASESGIAQTVNITGLPPPTVVVAQGETLPNAIGLLLVALIGLVAVSRRGTRQVGKEQ